MIRQPEVPLRVTINHFVSQDSRKKIVNQSISQRVTPTTINVKDKSVIARLKMGTDASDDWHSNTLLLSRLTTLFAIPTPVRMLDSTQKSDDLRDITKGYVYELMREIEKDPITATRLAEALKKDVSIALLKADLKDAKRITNTLKAMERNEFTERLRGMPDMEREITKELIDRGLAPTMITREDRARFAEELERTEEETGVGLPVDAQDQGDLPAFGDADERGQYGDYGAEPNNDGRDYIQVDQFDDDERGV
jgi:hypothetical protein